MKLITTCKMETGFTILELVIVIIIVGVLASLALPRFFKLVEYSRSVEALNSLGAIRNSMERCYLWSSSYSNCSNLANLDISDPGLSPNAHYTYSLPPGAATASTFTITATRNTRDGGANYPGATITLKLTAANSITRTGTGVYIGLK